MTCSSVLYILHRTNIIPPRFKIQKDKKLASFREQWNAMLYVLATQAFIQLPPNLLVIYYNLGDFGANMKCTYADMPPWYHTLFISWICLIIEDAWHYFAHRALHHKSVYGAIHKLHHEYTAPFTHTAEYAHPIETIILGVGFFIGLYWLCMDHVILMWGWLLLRLCETYEAHSGYDVPLLYGNLLKLMPGYGGAYIHDFHHKNFLGNYASTFMWWDIICGTNKQFAADLQRTRAKECQAITDKMVSEVQNSEYEATLPSDVRGKLPPVCLVTGGLGMVGQRLCAMLLEYGVQKVISVDVREKDKHAITDARISYVVGNICNVSSLEKVFKSESESSTIGCVFHIAALVGPYYKHELYYAVNFVGTQNVIGVCKKYGVSMLVDCSSPSTRMSTFDINGMSEQDFVVRGQGDPYAKPALHEYGRTKALAEKLVLGSNDAKNGFCTAVIAPHQVYGENDQLFLPNFIQAAKSGKLFIFGDGQSTVSFTHVDNVCWALILAAYHLHQPQQRSKIGGEFYFVTDDGAYNIWDKIEAAIKEYDASITPITQRMYLNKYLLYALGYVGELYTKATGKFVKLTPFTVRMLTMNRYFSIKKIKTELGYRPLIEHEKGWNDVMQSVVKRMRSTQNEK
eukprot:CAMPEP_0202687828 /NCGR_PEP_ID=MMETSP1385-20130828/3423_1 /ASSEMBLY_ACC=CAM_ASM_000861 /TAXON_ID=933848 /ORGANISM="Elphidium margaritaceum" /LENGTH=627 /DNA_ID=CAMNT_0049342677 /DNA_START=183 /DNA_END=2066 /DNA_ORIENTATION=+